MNVFTYHLAADSIYKTLRSSGNKVLTWTLSLAGESYKTHWRRRELACFHRRSSNLRLKSAKVPTRTLTLCLWLRKNRSKNSKWFKYAEHSFFLSRLKNPILFGIACCILANRNKRSKSNIKTKSSVVAQSVELRLYPAKVSVSSRAARPTAYVVVVYTVPR